MANRPIKAKNNFPLIKNQTTFSAANILWSFIIYDYDTKTALLLTLFEKSNFCPKIQFWQNLNIFMSFSSKFFWQFFSWNQSCQQLTGPKPQHFHEFFTQKIDNFHGILKLNFWTKNEDFEQCAKLKLFYTLKVSIYSYRWLQLQSGWIDDQLNQRMWCQWPMPLQV